MVFLVCELSRMGFACRRGLLPSMGFVSERARMALLLEDQT
jgi:hypothetical protein